MFVFRGPFLAWDLHMCVPCLLFNPALKETEKRKQTYVLHGTS